MGLILPTLGPRCAPDSLILLNIGAPVSDADQFPTLAPPKAQYASDSLTCIRPSPTQTQVGRRPVVRRKPLDKYILYIYLIIIYFPIFNFDLLFDSTNNTLYFLYIYFPPIILIFVFSFFQIYFIIVK